MNTTDNESPAFLRLQARFREVTFSRDYYLQSVIEFAGNREPGRVGGVSMAISNDLDGIYSVDFNLPLMDNLANLVLAEMERNGVRVTG